MGAKTGISWTDATWTPIRARVKPDAAAIAEQKGYGSLVQIAKDMAGRVGPHCEKASPGCQHCYSETNNSRCLPHNGTGLPFDRRSRDLVDIHLDEKILLQPLRWKKGRRIFVCSQTDLFGEFVPDDLIDRVFAVMALCPQHTFQLLTKRPERMEKYINDKRRSAAIAGEVRGVANRRGRQNLEIDEASRQRSDAGRGILPRGNGESLCSRPGRVSDQGWLLASHEQNQRREDHSSSAPISLDCISRLDTSGPDGESSERCEGRQPNREFGISDDVGTEEARAGRAEGEQEPPERLTEPEDQIDREGRSSDERSAIGGPNGEGYRCGVRHESEGRLGNLQQEDLAARVAWPLPNVWLGVSVEDQRRADERIPHLLRTPAAVRFLSCEPLLEMLDLTYPRGSNPPERCCSGRDCGCFGLPVNPPLLYDIDWVITGSESGPGARPCQEDWIRSLRDQCVAAGTSFFYKQWAVNGRKVDTPELDGKRWVEFPEVRR